jgi:hypothetical protein
LTYDGLEDERLTTKQFEKQKSEKAEGDQILIKEVAQRLTDRLETPLTKRSTLRSYTLHTEGVGDKRGAQVAWGGDEIIGDAPTTKTGGSTSPQQEPLSPLKGAALEKSEKSALMDMLQGMRSELNEIKAHQAETKSSKRPPTPGKRKRKSLWW